MGTLPASLLNAPDGTVAGTITWPLTVPSGAFNTYLSSFYGPGPVFTVTQTFLSNNFVTSWAGYTANSWDGTGFNLTLWGADGFNPAAGT